MLEFIHPTLKILCLSLNWVEQSWTVVLNIHLKYNMSVSLKQVFDLAHQHQNQSILLIWSIVFSSWYGYYLPSKIRHGQDSCICVGNFASVDPCWRWMSCCRIMSYSRTCFPNTKRIWKVFQISSRCEI